ncbi:MAG TPA: hypothetical protein VGD91_30555 [Trebonia sp.]
MFTRKRLAIVASFAVLMSAGVLANTGVAQAATCMTSARFGQCGPYDYNTYHVSNNMWGSTPGSSQTLTASGMNSWSVVSTVPYGLNSKGFINVESYPNSSENLTNTPLGNYSTLNQSFNVTKVPACSTHDAWEIAADDWLNALPGQSGTIEVMVWEDVCHTQPRGSYTGNQTKIGNQTFQLWYSGTNGVTLSLVPVAGNFETSGTIPDIDVFDYLEGLGYLSNLDSVAQLSLGEEILSTNNNPFTWTWRTSDNTIALKGR